MRMRWSQWRAQIREEVDSRAKQLGTEEQVAGCFPAAFEALFLFITVNQGNNLFPREGSLLERSPRLKDRFSMEQLGFS